jgi:YegS/Rv2252/BmrU family lipid kinase
MGDLRKIIAIINPKSGTKSKSKVQDKISASLKGPNYQLTILETQYVGHAIELSERGVKDNVDTIIAIGGDGTVNEVSSVMIDSPTKLGVISMGSGNGFSRHSGLHGSIDNAIDIIKTGYSELIDTCTLNGKPFINIAGIGIDGEVAYLTKSNTKRGLLPYVRSTLTAKGLKKPFSAIICYNDKCIQGDYRAIVVANAQRYGFDFKIAPLASMQDGLLESILIKDAAFWKYLFDFPKFINGKLAKSKLVDIYKSKDLVIKLDDPQYHHIDGEGSNDQILEFKFEIKPKSLRLIVAKNRKNKL